MNTLDTKKLKKQIHILPLENPGTELINKVLLNVTELIPTNTVSEYIQINSNTRRWNNQGVPFDPDIAWTTESNIRKAFSQNIEGFLIEDLESNILAMVYNNPNHDNNHQILLSRNILRNRLMVQKLLKLAETHYNNIAA